MQIRSGSGDHASLKEKAKIAWVVCHECGQKYGRVPDGNATMSGTSSIRKGTCGICGRRKLITDFRDYGYAK